MIPRAHPSSVRLLALLGALPLLACTTAQSTTAPGGAPARPAREASVRSAAPEAPALPGAARDAPAVPTGPAISVTWEALARERYLMDNSRYKRRGPTPPQQIILLSASHPEAERARVPRTRAERDKYANTAVLPDRDLLDFLKGLDRSGFYRYARPGTGGPALLENENARGRVTVERNGSARTLVSLRGQGLDDESKDIPRLYSEAKQAIMVMRNMTPTLNVQHFGADPLRR